MQNQRFSIIEVNDCGGVPTNNSVELVSISKLKVEQLPLVKKSEELQNIIIKSIHSNISGSKISKNSFRQIEE